MPVEVFHPIANTVQVYWKAQRGGKLRENVIHYQYTAPRPTQSELDALLDDITNSILGVTGIPSVTMQNTNWYEIGARDVHDAFGATTIHSIGVTGLYGQASANNSNVSLALSKRTGVAARFARGRLFLFDTPENMFDEDLLNIIFVPALSIICAHLLASRSNGRFRAAVGSRVRALSVQLTAMNFDFVADSQRRRLQGRGA